MKTMDLNRQEHPSKTSYPFQQVQIEISTAVNNSLGTSGYTTANGKMRGVSKRLFLGISICLLFVRYCEGVASYSSLCDSVGVCFFLFSSCYFLIFDFVMPIWNRCFAKCLKERTRTYFVSKTLSIRGPLFQLLAKKQMKFATW